MKKFLFITTILFSSEILSYDEYNILIDSSLNNDEVEYFQQNCKRNEFSYVCMAILNKMEEKNGK
jgi:hypothetical protein